MISTVTTNSAAARMQVGDVVSLLAVPPWRRLRMLFTKPRVLVACAVSASSFELEERRMSWREWWAAVTLAVMEVAHGAH